MHRVPPKHLVKPRAVDTLVLLRPGRRQFFGQRGFALLGQNQAPGAALRVGEGGGNGMQAVNPDRARRGRGRAAMRGALALLRRPLVEWRAWPGTLTASAAGALLAAAMAGQARGALAGPLLRRARAGALVRRRAGRFHVGAVR